jgi:hypothetical protein
MEVVSFTPRSLYPQGRRPWYPFDMRLGGPQRWSGQGGEEKNSPCRDSNPRSYSPYPNAILLRYRIAPRFLDPGTRRRWVLSFTSRPLYSWERAHGTHWIGGWVGYRAGMEAVTEKFPAPPPGIEPPNPDRPPQSQSLYWLGYSGS